MSHENRNFSNPPTPSYNWLITNVATRGTRISVTRVVNPAPYVLRYIHYACRLRMLIYLQILLTKFPVFDIASKFIHIYRLSRIPDEQQNFVCYSNILYVIIKEEEEMLHK